MQDGKRLLIVSHGNTLRAIRMHVEKISEKAITKVEIPMASPLVYRFNSTMELVDMAYLDSP